MATKVVMEALSPTMEEGRLVKWNKNEGDAVKNGDVLAEVETDKAVMELVARGDGVLRKRLANEGDASPVGTLLAVIATPDENIDSIVGSAAAAPAAAPASAAKPAPAVVSSHRRNLRARLRLLRRRARQPRVARSVVLRHQLRRRVHHSVPPHQGLRALRRPRGTELDVPARLPLPAGASAHHRWRAGSPATRESSWAESRARVQAAASSSAISRTRKRRAVPDGPPPPTGSRPRATSRTSRSLRSERRSRAGSPSRTVRFRHSFSPRNSMRRVPPRCARSSRRWAISTRCRSTTS